MRRISSIWAPPMCVAALIFALSTLRGNSFPKHPEILNIAAHTVEFMALAFLTSRALVRSGFTRRPSITFAWTVAICAIFGLLDEIHQFSVPTRQFDPMDILADTVGAVIGSCLFLQFMSVFIKEDGEEVN